MAATRFESPWNGREGLLILLSFIVLVSLFSAAHMGFIKLTIGFEAYLGDGPRMPPSLLLISQWGKAIAILLVIYGLALARKRLGWAALGFRACERRWLLIAALLPWLALPLLLALNKTLVFALPEFARFSASRYGWHDGPPWLMLSLILTTVLVTPLAEEIFFRGFLFRWMAARRPLWLAAIVSSAMFGASHMVPPQMIVAFLLSLALLWLYVRSGSLWPCIVCHVINNLLGVLLGMAAVEGWLPAWLTPPVS